MISNRKKKFPTKRIILPGIVILFLLLLAGCGRAENERRYLTSRAELMKALSEPSHEEIFVGDISFDENDLYVPISRSVRLIGKPDGSVFNRGIFVVTGPEQEKGRIAVSFENIAFDGGYEMPAGDPADFATFDEMHGDRGGKNAFCFLGQLGVSFRNCDFRRYCSKYAAAMLVAYRRGDDDVNTHVDLFLDDCRFENNISEKGILWFNGKTGSESDLVIQNTTFSENRVYTGVVTLGNVKGRLENVTVRDSVRTVYREKNTYAHHSGGGLHIANSELLIKNCVIDGNGAGNGGGVAIASSAVTLDGCSIINNRADEKGGGLLIESSERSPVYITNCFISGNEAKQEGAVWVWPADQINIGVPTGITEFSFCTFENNRSDDDGHLVFHPIVSESPETTIGRDGRIDFYACRILDDKVSPSLKNGENANVVNSGEKGDPVPTELVSFAANGYYGRTTQTLYAGINEITPPTDLRLPLLIGLAVLAAAAVLTGVVLWARRKKPSAPDAPPEADPKDAPTPGTPEARSTAPTDAEIALALERAAEKGLTAREIDVLREYLSGRSRQQIAESLFISESTVKNHISNIFFKLKVKNREELWTRLTGAPGGGS